MAQSESGRARRGGFRIAALSITVAGSSSAVPRPGCACSCYVVQSASTRIALDCGSGAVQSMRKHLDPATLDAVVISHMHSDHMLDLVPLRYLLWLGPTQRATPLDVYVHPGAIERLHRLGDALPSSEGARFFEKTMRLHEYDPAVPLAIGDMRITFARTIHYIEAYAMTIAANGKTIAYSADTAPCAQVIECARDADLFLCESALGPYGADSDPRGHCNAAEAGQLAASAGARHLMLTHYSSDFRADELHAAAATTFDGPITIADDGLTLQF